MPLAPIVIFCYNRPDKLKKILVALEANAEFKDSEVYFFCDGSKANASAAVLERIKATREVVKSKTWGKKTTITEASQNKGLANFIIEGVTQVVNQHKKIIVLEDDILVSPAFLEYMNYSLDYFQNNEKVSSIQGFSYPIKNMPPYYFLYGADCWGWATWKRAWDTFEKDAIKLQQQVSKLKMAKDLDFSYPYTKLLQKQVNGEVDSWAVRWHISCFIQKKLMLCPGISFIQNIGFDGEGSHTFWKDDSFDIQIVSNHFNSKDILNMECSESFYAKNQLRSFLRKKSIKRILYLPFIIYKKLIVKT